MSLLSQVGRTIQGLKNTDLSGRFIPGSMKQTIDRMMPSRQAFQEGLRTVGAGISQVGGAMSKARMPGFARYTPPGIMTGVANRFIGGQISGVGDTLQKTGVSKFTLGDALNMSAILPMGAGTKAIGKAPATGREFVKTIRPAAKASAQVVGDAIPVAKGAINTIRPGISVRQAVGPNKLTPAELSRVDDGMDMFRQEVSKYKSPRDFVKARKGMIDIPVKSIKSAEPSTAARTVTESGRKVTEPVEVVWNQHPNSIRDNGEFVLLDGNHRLQQAILNGDKTIRARVDIADDWIDDMGNQHLLNVDRTPDTIKRITNLDPTWEVGTKENLKKLIEAMSNRVRPNSEKSINKLAKYIKNRPPIEDTYDNVITGGYGSWK